MKIAVCLVVLALTLLPQADGPGTAASPPTAAPRERMSAAAQTCVPCHGANGEGKPDAGFPRIAGQSAYYLLKQLDDYAEGRRIDPAMAPIARGLSRELRASVAAHYAHAAADATARPSTFTASWVERGRVLAVHGDHERGVQACINCHGPSGIGQPPTVPYLAGLDAGYIRSTLDAWRDGRRHNDAGQQMVVIAKALSTQDVASVARYFAGVAPPRPAPRDVMRAGTPQFLPPNMTVSMTIGATASGASGVDNRAALVGGKESMGQSGRFDSPGAAGNPGTDARESTRDAPSGAPGERPPGAADAARGRALVAGGAFGCTACHMVPGVRAPRGIAGPRLGGLNQKPLLAGQLPNNREVLAAFLQDPPALVPGTGMPNVGLRFEDARDIAAFLYTLPIEQ